MQVTVIPFPLLISSLFTYVLRYRTGHKYYKENGILMRIFVSVADYKMNNEYSIYFILFLKKWLFLFWHHNIFSNNSELYYLYEIIAEEIGGLK